MLFMKFMLVDSQDLPYGSPDSCASLLAAYGMCVQSDSYWLL